MEEAVSRKEDEGVSYNTSYPYNVILVQEYLSCKVLEFPS